MSVANVAQDLVKTQRFFPASAAVKPRASASFDAKRLASFRMLLASSQADGSSRDYVESVEAECRRLAVGLIAGEQVAA